MKENNDLYYKKAFLLGNGFDRANNHPTSYEEFIDSSYYKKLLNQDNKLAEAIKNKYDSARWVDIETETGYYSKYIEDTYINEAFKRESIKFKEDFIRLKNSLYWYIDGLRRGVSNPKMEDLIHSWKNSLCGTKPERAFFVTFNYMPWDFAILREKISDQHFVDNNPLFIHGMTQYDVNAKPNIVFGVSENSVYCKKHEFLVKRNDKYCKADKFFKHIFDAKHFIIFGCSMGDTDRCYFEPLFSQAIGKKFEIYYYKEKGKKEIIENLSSMCDINKLNNLNEIEMIDSSIFQNK